jgi:hypothetical protein
MPVILEDEEARQAWLRADGNDPSSAVLRLLRPYKGEHIVFDKVSTMVNSMKNVCPPAILLRSSVVCAMCVSVRLPHLCVRDGHTELA